VQSAGGFQVDASPVVTLPLRHKWGIDTLSKSADSVGVASWEATLLPVCQGRRGEAFLPLRGGRASLCPAVRSSSSPGSIFFPIAK